MPRRSDKRDAAREAYLSRRRDGEEVNLQRLAEELGVIYRGATQCALKSGGFATKQLRIVEGGIVKGFKGGSLEAGSQMEASVTLETVRYKMENAGEELIAIDKLNNIYRVKGKDMLAELNKMI